MRLLTRPFRVLGFGGIVTAVASGAGVRLAVALVAVLTVLLMPPDRLLAAGCPGATLGDTPDSFPSLFNVYTYSNGDPICDENNDESPSGSDIWSGFTAVGSTKEVRTLPSVYITIGQHSVFFRMRLALDPGGSSPVFLQSLVWTVLVADSAGNLKGCVGVDGKSCNNFGYVFIFKSAGGTLTPIYESNAGGLVGARTSTASDGTNPGYFLDYQVPLARIYSLLGISPNTPLKFYYATTLSTNPTPLNKDLMIPGAGGADYTSLQTISLQQALLSIGKSATAASGPNPPQVGVTTTYNMSVQISNTGGNIANTVHLADKVPNGALVLGKTSTYGNISGTGQDVDWQNFSVAASKTVTASITVSVTPTDGDVDKYILLNKGSDCTLTASDGPTGNSTTAIGNDVTVGPVQPAPAGQSVTGTAYLDANHNSLLDATEGGTGLTLYAKRVPAAGGPAEEAVVVAPASGAFTFAAVANGTYTVVLDDNNTLSDISPTLPAAYVGTEAPAFTRGFTMNGIVLSGVNLGLYLGAKVSGTVFADTGTGGGTANNGTQDGGETGISGVTVYARTGTDTLLDRDVTDALGDYTLFVPDSSGSVKVVQTNLANHVSTGGSAGNTGGSYARDTDTVSYTFASGQGRTGVDFGDVPQNTFVPDGMQTGLPGAMVLYRHLFNAGTAGQVTFTTTHTAVPSLTGWTSALYRDENCNGALDGSETLVSGAIGVTAGEQLCLLASEFIPANATVNAQDQLVLTAAFTYTGASPALSGSQSRTDVTMVGTASAAGLLLTKTADLATARPGQTIVYTIAYTNRSKDNLSNVTLQDFTPAYTSYVSAACGTTPSGITGCTVTTQPSMGAKGALKWTLTGVLKPGLSGTVTYSVTVD